jgi:hypothetical protein
MRRFAEMFESSPVRRRRRGAADRFWADLMGLRGPEESAEAWPEAPVRDLLPDPERRRREAWWQLQQQQQNGGGLVTRCGFFGPSGAARTTSALRAAIVASARAEWTAWHAAGVPKRENEVAMFGNLVRYYLAAITDVRPDTLTAMQAAAIAATTNYGTLPATGSTNEIQRVRALLMAGAAGPTTPSNLTALVDNALRGAHEAHVDNGGGLAAWSAVWVSACVRGAGISAGLEAMVGTNHVGKDGLLKVAVAHWEYVREAHARTVARQDGTYQAFDPATTAPEAGDIIVQHRGSLTAGSVFRFANLSRISSMITHGDIVVDVHADDVVTLGGNLTGGVPHDESVRQRRYPLSGGLLVIEAGRSYSQEDATGTLPALPAATTPAAGASLDDHSTRRIFALLKPVELCAAIPGQPYRGGVLT